MRKIILALFLASSLWSTQTFAQKKTNTFEVQVSMDLNVVQDDKIMVTVIPPTSSANEITYHIPKIIPGTYSVDDYGKMIDLFKAFDKKGKELIVTKTDDNSWTIKNAKTLAKITYWVNDTFDTESGGGFGKESIFSPAGTNINEGKNFMLNNHGFIGYFANTKDITYTVTITHPETLVGVTSLIDTDNSTTKDVFVTSRYNELVDNPIMYSKPDSVVFNVDGMEINFSVFSPTGKHTAASLSVDLEKMMRAQKKFLGPINSNKKYTVLLYLSTMQKNDAKGFGALEHNTSTTVVFPEMMPSDALGKQLIDVVSHEFFHIVTPLSVHSNEIHYFDFNKPKMSKHLWMYEGVTEYFANLFQINQDLITEEAFYLRMADKIDNAAKMNDTMPFTVMSANVLEKPYKDQYLNVYEKGALIGMCIDIIIREKSNGERGVLDLMQKLTAEYGAEKPFNDDELFDKIVQLTYPEVGAFLTTYVSGTTPIDYNEFLAKVGVSKAKIQVPSNPFLKGQSPYVTINPTTKEIMVIPNSDLNEFMTSLGIKGGDTILSINDINYNLDTIYDMIMASQNWKTGDAITIKIKRNNKEQVIKGKVKLSFDEMEGYQSTDASKAKLKQAWLKG
jgi:predicted metalloprotease with PDZ domain